ncbi:MAG TPA: alpha/beta hydrolase-fold protein [Allosphingosinicella sp.]|jgi:predicted alpha/beta superfamily hydrolase|nr:alpha/beta hydrolase-fold protein [Allosphingosinicella sp.]
MRLWWTAAFAAAISCFTAAPAAAQPAPAGEPIVLGSSHALRSAALGEERRINVRLPSGYATESERRYPVLYVLDGGVAQDFPHMAGLAQHGEISGTFDEFIVVGIETKNRIRELTTPNRDERYVTFYRANGEPVEFANGGGAEGFRRHIAEEVIPWIEANHRTNGRRTLIGESLAALFVVDTLLRRADLFHDYVAISPSLWWNREELGRTAPRLLDAQNYEGRRLYLTMAGEGGTMQRGLDSLLAALRSPAAGALRWVHVDRRNSEHHGSIYHVAALDSLRTLYPKPWRPGTPIPWLHIGEPPVLSEAAIADRAIPCTRDRARTVTFAEVHANPARWEAFCILSPLGQAPEPREHSRNWRR